MCRVPELNGDIKMDIENMLLHYVPEVVEVRPAY